MDCGSIGKPRNVITTMQAAIPMRLVNWRFGMAGGSDGVRVRED